ncbi:hypothetical protein LCGC14_1607130, partial [marine sediment metagenome]
DFTNNESRQPLNESFVSMTNGEYFNTTEMQVDDDIYTGYNYTGVGEYRATYSFTDEYDGISGTDIGFVDAIGVGYSALIVSDYDGHRKVISNSRTGSFTHYPYNAISQVSGTIEFWMNEASLVVNEFILVEGVSNYLVIVDYDLDNTKIVLYHGNGVGGNTVVDTTVTGWAHIRITFDCATDTFSAWVNGVSKITDENFYSDNTATSVTRVGLASAGVNTGYYDAIGYSWDNDYMIGWNREEYVFFGDYNATYSFEDELIGEEGTTIDLIDTYVEDVGYSNITIDGGIAGHKKVLQLHQTAGGSITSYLSYDFPQLEIDMTIEFWIWMSGTSDWGNNLMFYFNEDSTNIVRIYFDYTLPGYIKTDTQEIASSAESFQEVWQHVKIILDDTANTFDFYLNGINMGTFNYRVPSTVGIDQNSIYIDFHVIGSSDYYIDAIDYSWSPGYSNGRNRLTENDDILGHYPASHSFPFDDVGSAPEGWDSAAYTVIGSAWQEHRKVLKLTRDGSNPIIERDFYTDITSGTIELYMGSDDVTQLSHLRLYDGASSVIQINLYDDKLQYRYDGAYNPILDPILDNKWYHIKLDFETSAGLYKGLAADTFYITIDGTQYGPYPFNNVAPHVDKIYFTCNSAAVYNYYVDAIDYSWDPYYSVGRNLNPTVANMLGQYPGTYSFESELVYASGTEIDGIDVMGVAYTAEIIESYAGHRKVLKVHRGGTYSHYPYHIIDQTSGIVELYIGASAYLVNIIIVEGATNLVLISFDPVANWIRMYYSATYVQITYTGDFPHIKMEFDTITDTHSIWVDGIKYIDNKPFYLDVFADSATRIIYTGANGVDFYFDAISYSWDDNYLIGDNLHYNNFLGSETFEGYNETESGFYYGTESFDYKTEEGVYYGTYDFRDEADGMSGTSIDFVDFVNLYDGGVEIVSSWQSHNKVLRLQDDATAGEDPHFHHNIVQTTSGTHEFWIGTNDVTKYWEFYTFEGGIGYINRLRISASSISYFDGGAWNVLIAVSNNILYHVQLVWRADNTQDIYINGVLEADNVSTDDNMVSGVNRIFFKCFGDSTDYLYLDAYGETEDTTSHGGLGYTVDYNILSQDIEPILEGGYEIDNI